MSRDDWLNTYTPTWERRLRMVALSEYHVGRYVDSDDREFMRSYCGSLREQDDGNELWAAPTADFLDDDAEYDTDFTLPRPVRPRGQGRGIEGDQAYRQRQQKYFDDLARKRAEQMQALREAHETATGISEAEKRMLRTMLSDVEWERHSILRASINKARYAGKAQTEIEPEAKRPKGRRFSVPPVPLALKVDAHNRYVPQWKLYEHERAEEQRREREAVEEAARVEQWKAQANERWKAREERARNVREQKAAEELARRQRAQAIAEQRRKVREAELIADRDRKRAAWQAEHDRQMADMREHAARIKAKHDAEQPVSQFQQERQRMLGREALEVRKSDIKRIVLNCIRGSGRVWAVEELMQKAGCDRELLLRCCNELVGGGYLAQSGQPA